MSEHSSVKWINMVDSIYTLCALAGVDTDVNNVTGISIVHNRIIVWYIDNLGTARHISKGYSL
jgi:hypothetical protein